VKRPLILVVDDEPTVLRALRVALEAQDYVVSAVLTGEDALARITNASFDLVLLDLGLPGMNGFDVIRRVRVLFPTLPIIVLSAQGEDAAKVEALDLGADDYVAKPFSYPILHARAAALMRRVDLEHPRRATVRECGTLRLDSSSRACTLGGQDVKLSQKEYLLLWALMADPTRVITKTELLRTILVRKGSGSTRTLDSHACRLRWKLGDGWVVNVWGVGYRLITEAPVAA
jgi:DNA-binding response OmpR family regulator